MTLLSTKNRSVWSIFLPDSLWLYTIFRHLHQPQKKNLQVWQDISKIITSMLISANRNQNLSLQSFNSSTKVWNHYLEEEVWSGPMTKAPTPTEKVNSTYRQLPLHVFIPFFLISISPCPSTFLPQCSYSLKSHFIQILSFYRTVLSFLIGPTKWHIFNYS